MGSNEERCQTTMRFGSSERTTNCRCTMVQADNEYTGIGLVLNPESINFEIELLAPYHDRAAFSCGNEQLDRYLYSTATQDRKRNIAISDVVYDKDRQKIIGYYTLSRFKLFRTMINIEGAFDIKF
jgi:hypothetical protein